MGIDNLLKVIYSLIHVNITEKICKHNRGRIAKPVSEEQSASANQEFVNGNFFLIRFSNNYHTCSKTF